MQLVSQTKSIPRIICFYTSHLILFVVIFKSQLLMSSLSSFLVSTSKFPHIAEESNHSIRLTSFTFTSHVSILNDCCSSTLPSMLSTPVSQKMISDVLSTCLLIRMVLAAMIEFPTQMASIYMKSTLYPQLLVILFIYFKAIITIYNHSRLTISFTEKRLYVSYSPSSSSDYDWFTLDTQ
jgi:hypothetical protein